MNPAVGGTGEIVASGGIQGLAVIAACRVQNNCSGHSSPGTAAVSGFEDPSVGAGVNDAVVAGVDHYRPNVSRGNLHGLPGEAAVARLQDPDIGCRST